MENTPIFVVIPAYNEATVLAEVIRSVMPYASAVVVVDDCSSDATSSTAYDAGAMVLRHAINLGQGAALQTGIDFALIMGAEIIVMFDADGQHDPAEIPRLLAALQEHSAEIAFGSRFLGRAMGLSLGREVLLKLAAFYTRMETGLKISDTQNGLRALTASAARRIRLRQNRMAHATEIIQQTARHKLRYVEVPTTIRYTEYSLRKGQKLSQGILILCDLVLGRMIR